MNLSLAQSDTTSFTPVGVNTGDTTRAVSFGANFVTDSTGVNR